MQQPWTDSARPRPLHPPAPHGTYPVCVLPAVRTVALALAATAALATTACSGGTPDSPARIATQEDGFFGTVLPEGYGRPELRLTDTAGTPFDLRGRPADEITVLFFGYTHCPDVCPTTMADLAAARRALTGDLQQRVTIVFVSEDPRRDTRALLRSWLDRFDRDIVGLIGGNAASRQAIAALKLSPTSVVASPSRPVSHPPDHVHEGDHGLGYAIEHPGSVYVFGPGGQALIYTGGTLPDQYAADFTRLGP